jgi:hypothetical protein
MNVEPDEYHESVARQLPLRQDVDSSFGTSRERDLVPILKVDEPYRLMKPQLKGAMAFN